MGRKKNILTKGDYLKQFLQQYNITNIYDYILTDVYLAKIRDQEIRYIGICHNNRILNTKRQFGMTSILEEVIPVEVIIDKNQDITEEGYWGFFRYFDHAFQGIYNGYYRACSFYPKLEKVEENGFGILLKCNVRKM